MARERAEVATLVVDLEGLAERGRAALQAREQAGLPAPIDLAGEALARAHADAESERIEQASAWTEGQAERSAARKAAKQAIREANREAWRARRASKSADDRDRDQDRDQP